MAEVAYGNYHYQNYGNQSVPNMQQYNHSPPVQVIGSVPSRLGHQAMQNQRYNPYQRPSPPTQQHIRHNQQHQGHMRQTQMVNRHSYNPNQQWMNGGKAIQEDYNSNPMYFNQAPRQNNWQQQNNGFYQDNVMRQPQVMKSVSPPLVPSANFQNNGHDQIQDQVIMRRRMSSSSQCSDYSSMAPSNDGRQWMVSPNSNQVQQSNQFHPQGAQFASQASPNTGAIPTWNGSLPHSTPSPLSSISSDNSPPPPQYIPYNQQNQFRHPSAIQPPVPKLQPPVPQVNVPLVSTEIPPGTTTGTSGNDWAVNCLGTEVKLRNSDLWKHFDNVVMEMVISKHGRRMFPVLEYDIKGLHPFKLYSVFVDFVLANKYVWKFSEQKWNPSGLAPEEDAYDQSHRVCLHPDSPAPGEVWNKRGASFSKMKLSNHLHTESDKLSLKSLHKYQPRLHVVEVDPRDPTIQTNLRTFIIPKTRFMTVTLYHNTDVAQLKINLNPFARCFRDKEISPMSKPNEIDRQQPVRSVVSYDVTSPSSNETLESISVISPTSHEQKTVYKVSNPISESDLTRAKNFMQAQLDTMTQLVRTQDALNQGSEPKQSAQDTTNTEENKRSQTVNTVDFDRELEGLLSTITNPSTKETSSASGGEGQEKKTVHHYPPASEGTSCDVPKTKYIKKEKPPNDGNLLEKYELLNVDRCFPPNVVAPMSNTLPFNPSEIQKDKTSKDKNKKLPTFFKCSYYQEQAAAQARLVSTNKQNNNESNLPVIYVPKPAVTSSSTTTVVTEQAEVSMQQEEKQHHVLDTSPASSAASSESITSFNPYPLPTLSPKSLRQFLDEDLNDMMSGNKRKCSFDDDIDDDVFGNDSSLLNVCGMFQGQAQQPMQQFLSTQGFL